jgi:transcriptional regulator with XRE-family HTH domain
VDQARQTFGTLLRQWRGQRGCSQLSLALQAEVSARHISWLETGKAQPSRAMVLRLAEQLDVPLRERNHLLLAAGFAALYTEHALTAPQLAPALAALQRLLDANEPWPALVVDRHWRLVAHNRLVPLLIASAAPHLLQPPVNVLRLSLHPQGLAPHIHNLGAWRSHILARLQRQCNSTQDPALHELLAELQAMPSPLPLPSQAAGAAPLLATETPNAETAWSDVAVPLQFNTASGTLNFLTTLTVFGAPHDLTLAELAIETLLPADTPTADALRAMHANLG